MALESALTRLREAHEQAVQQQAALRREREVLRSAHAALEVERGSVGLQVWALEPVAEGLMEMKASAMGVLQGCGAQGVSWCSPGVQPPRYHSLRSIAAPLVCSLPPTPCCSRD